MSKMNYVEQVMTEKVTVAHLGNRFSQVMDFFQEFRIHHLPVTDGDQVLGILSVHDMLHYLHNRLKEGKALDPKSLDDDFRIGEVMTHHPVTVTPQTTLLEVLDVFDKGKFRALPVVDDGKLRGILTLKDLMRVYSWEKHEYYTD